MQQSARNYELPPKPANRPSRHRFPVVSRRVQRKFSTDPLKRKPKGSPTLGDRLRRVFWSWWLWAALAIALALVERWGMGYRYCNYGRPYAPYCAA